MSIIASFYLVRIEDVAKLKYLAKQPVGFTSRKFLWIKFKTHQWHDPFWNHLHEKTQELGKFNWSGSAMLAVDYFLESSLIELSGFTDQELTDYFSKTRGSGNLVFNREGAVRLRETIARLNPTPESIEEFLDSTKEIPEDMPLQAFVDGVTILTDWLSQVDDSCVGLLHIG